jgi:hypothetical protein
MKRPYRWITAFLAVGLVSCANRPPAKPIYMMGGWCWPGKFQMTASRLNAGPPIGWSAVLADALYPDRPRRLMVEGRAIYTCRLVEGAVACEMESQQYEGAPDWGFDGMGKSIARHLPPDVVGADGLRMAMDFKVVEKPGCNSDR